MTKSFVGPKTSPTGAPNSLNTESVWKQENDKILCWAKKRHKQGTPNDLLDV